MNSFDKNACLTDLMRGEGTKDDFLVHLDIRISRKKEEMFIQEDYQSTRSAFESSDNLRLFQRFNRGIKLAIIYHTGIAFLREDYGNLYDNSRGQR